MNPNSIQTTKNSTIQNKSAQVVESEQKPLSKQKVVLAYSGGLDTSIILKWLIDKGYEVIAFIADVGQDEDFNAAKQKALAVGATKVFIEDLKEEFVTEFIFKALKGNAVYEGQYLLGTSLSRPLIAKKQIEIAKQEGAEFVSHGATGKGNDQVRFELTYLALFPKIKIIAPWKDKDFLTQFEGRQQLIDYAKENNIPIEATKKSPYSMDANLMHISYESGILEDPKTKPNKDMFKMTTDPENAPNHKTKLEIHFKNGIPFKVKSETQEYTSPLEMFKFLNKIGGENGIGRIDIVENRYVGIKSRGVYESPGATILWKAHQDIEGIAMDREVYRLKEMLSGELAHIIYNGYWYSPEMDFIMAAFNKSQELIDGIVYLELYKGNITITGRESPTSLYNQDLSSMDVEGGFDQTDSKGFININSIRLIAHNLFLENQK